MMALLEDEGDDGFSDEMLLAAMDAVVSSRSGLPNHHLQQQLKQQHPAPSSLVSAPHKKVAVTRVPTTWEKENSEPLPFAVTKTEVVTKSPMLYPHNPQSFHSNHRELRKSSQNDRDLSQMVCLKRGGQSWNTGGKDLMPDGFHSNGSPISTVGGRVGDVKQEEFIQKAGKGDDWRGRWPPQELRSWSDPNQVLESPASTVWLQTEKTRSSMEVNLACFPGMSGVAVFNEYQEAAMRTLMPTDYSVIHGKPFIKKTGWRKIAFFFNISFEIKDKNIQFDPKANVLRAEFVVRASMPSGRFTDSWGSCDRIEKRFNKPNHDIPSTAETRAKTRACQDLLGIGEYKADGNN